MSEQEEINNLDKIHWERNSWKQLSLIGDETVINLQRAKVYVFSDSVLCLGKIHQHPESNEAWKKRIEWITTDKSYRDNDGINGEPTEFEWNIFPGFTTLQLCGKVTDLLSRLRETPETFTGRILFMSMFNDISCDGKGNKEECLANARVVSILAKRFGIGQWSFIGPGSEKKWYSMEENSPQGIWDHIADEMLLEFAESGCPIFRATTPLSRGSLKSKGHGKLSIDFAADQETIETSFRIIVFANQLSLYGAVANMCEEFEFHQDRSGQPDVLMGQSIVLSEIKAEVLLENDIPSHQNLLLQQYEERIELLSQENTNVNLHSIINNGLIPGGQDLSRRQTVFFLPTDPRDESHKDPAQIDFSVPRRAKYVHRAWKRHQDAVFWVDIDLGIKEGLVFYQTRSNAIILQGTLPAHCIPKVVRLKTGEVLYEKSYMSPRPPPKISLRHDHDWTRGNDKLGSSVEQQPHGKVVRQSRGEVQHATFSQPTQPIPKPICDGSGKHDSTEDVFVVQGETSRSHEIDEKGFHGELCSSDRSGKPDNLSENTRVEQTHDGSGQPDERNSSSAHTVKEQFAPEDNRDIALFNTDNEFNRAINEEDIDFNIPGLQHSAVKQLHGASVRDMIQKIENHPHRHALQRDLQKRQQFNPFSQESKDMIRDVGNIELCELLDVEPKAQCKVCLSYWDVGIVYCTCGHFLRNGTEENKKFVQYTMDLLSIPNYYIKKGRPHGHRYGKKPGDHEYFIANSLKKKCRKRKFLGIHDRFIRDEKFRKNMFDVGRNEEICREMDKLANEDHTHRITEDEIRVYRNNWWIRPNTVGSDTMPIRHRADNKQALSTLR